MTLEQLTKDANGWRGTFYAQRVEGTDEVCDIVYVAEDGELDPDDEESFYLVAEMLDDHVAESLVRIINAARHMIPVLRAAEAWREHGPGQSHCDEEDCPCTSTVCRLKLAIDTMRAALGAKP